MFCYTHENICRLKPRYITVRQGVGVSGLIELQKSDLLLGFLAPAETAFINGFSKKNVIRHHGGISYLLPISLSSIISIRSYHTMLDSNGLPYDCSPLIPLNRLMIFILRLNEIVYLICIKKLSDFDRYVSFTDGFI
ncbi:unnamed protein product [Adineta ricciae]|uniref:Uncharacterized protein n=1 Tax=Adineta ricciae TaxID=249248 RepID=A0A815TRM7_ADIRI|nr:unnamed protein product [Adineta ricciae]